MQKITSFFKMIEPIAVSFAAALAAIPMIQWSLEADDRAAQRGAELLRSASLCAELGHSRHNASDVLPICEKMYATGIDLLNTSLD